MANIDYTRINKKIWAVVSLQENIKEQKDELGVYQTSKNSVGLVQFNDIQEYNTYFQKLEAREDLHFMLVASNVRGE